MKLNEKKGDRDLEHEIKNKLKETLLLEEQHEINYVAACSDKMRNASSHQCKEKM